MSTNSGKQFFEEKLDELALGDRRLFSPNPVRTALESADAFGTELSHIARTVVIVTEDDHLVFCIGPGSQKTDLEQVGRICGRRVHMLPRTEVLTRTGYDPSGVSPVPQADNTIVLIDRALNYGRDARLLVAAGSDQHMASLTFLEILRISGAYVYDNDAQASGLSYYVTHSAAKLGVRAEFVEIQKLADNWTRTSGAIEIDHSLAQSGGGGNGYSALLERAGVNEQVPSTVFLREFVTRRGRLPKISPIVDAYNAASFMLDVVASAHDRNLIVGNRILVDRSDGSERFFAIGATEEVGLSPGEWFIRDDAHLLCRNNCRQSDFSKVSEQTRDLLLYVQGYAGRPRNQLRTQLFEVAAAIQAIAGGRLAPVLPLDGEA